MTEIKITPHVVRPENPNRQKDMQYFRCPVCNRRTWVSEHEEWCTRCGARIDVVDDGQD